MRDVSGVKTLLAAGLLALAATAAAAQDRPLPVAVPAAFAAVGAGGGSFSGEAPAPAFWRELGDSTLARLVDAALDANPDVQAARARLAQAREARRLASFDLLPTVTSGGGYDRGRLSAAQAPGASGSQRGYRAFDAGVSGAWELDVFGRTRRTLRAGDALAGAAGEDLRDVRLALAAEVALAYLDLRGAQGQLAVALRNAENQRRTLALTEERLSAGRGNAFDSERARALMQLTLAGTPLLEARIDAARNRVALLLGGTAADLHGALDAPAAPPSLPAKVRVGSPESMLRSRPDVSAAERRAAAEEQLLGASRAEYLPRLSLVGGAGLNATSFDSLGRAGASRYQAGVAVSWPFLNLGRIRSQVGISRARAAEARALYASAALRAVQETESAMSGYDRSRARLAALESAGTASERAAELARLRFQEGMTDFLPVLDAERTLLDVQNQLAAARTDAAAALVGVYRALGATGPAEEGPAGS
ncbi:MAG: efflux system, outer rane lipoprotein NodT family [Gemmatimonadetes bacterium]|nr:efflux system, outer rane lipoprotein NodT family [Gemmatimonadota bacterium]